MKLLSSFVFGIVLVAVAGCGGKKNSQVNLMDEYNAKYGEVRNSIRQSQGVQPLPQGWTGNASAKQVAWTSPTPNAPGFVSKIVLLSGPKGSVTQEEDRFLLSAEMPPKAVSIVSQFDGDKVSKQTARKENATPEGLSIPLEEAKQLIKAVAK
jgi:uncharacterized lipoprotein YehR (DUF1307 family)